MFTWIKNIYHQGSTLPFTTWRVETHPFLVKSTPAVHIEEVREPRLKDHFQIHFYSDYTVRIRFGNARSKRYAIEALTSITAPIYVGVYEGGPDMEIRGIIEGFYGTPWSHENRKDVFPFSKKYHLNAYFYAPKDDLYHRDWWRLPYPEKELNQLLELVQLSFDHDVDFYFCISPGKDFIYTKAEEFELLYRKLDQLLQAGVHHFAILLDDIDYQLTGESLERFGRPGVAHAYIVNQVHRYLKSQSEDYQLVMCPTEYAQNVPSPYRSDLAKEMDPEVIVFWTGYNTVAEYIPNLDGVRLMEYFQHPLLLWDNYPVNDMAKDRLFLGPIRNRGHQLYQHHIGMVSNPMVEWHASKLAMITMALYMWDSAHYQVDESYLFAMNELASHDPEVAWALKIFADENYDSLIYENQDLHQEWIQTLNYPALDDYYQTLLQAITILETKMQYREFVLQCQPWFDRARLDCAMVQRIKEGTASQEAIAALIEEKHTLGKNVCLHLAVKLGLLEVTKLPKKRTIFWELKAGQL